MPNWPNGVSPAAVAFGAGVVLLFILYLVAVCMLLARDRQLAELSAQLEYQDAVNQWLRERLQQLVEEVETRLGSEEAAGVRLRLDQEGNLQEVGHARDV
jgi:hypothetical protein